MNTRLQKKFNQFITANGYKRRFTSVEAYMKEAPVEGVDFDWVDENGEVVPEVKIMIDFGFANL